MEPVFLGSVPACAQGCSRRIEYDPVSRVLVVSQRSPHSGTTMCGVTKLSCTDLAHREFIPLHSATVRDTRLSPRGDGLLLTASMDKTIKIANLAAGCTVLEHSTSAMVWSCEWKTDDPNYFFAGLNDSSVLMYDVRQLRTHVDALTGGGPGPVLALRYISAALGSDSGRAPVAPFLMGASLAGGLVRWTHRFQGDGASATAAPSQAHEHRGDASAMWISERLPLSTGACTSLTLSADSVHCLASYRAGATHRYTRHIVFPAKQNAWDRVESVVECLGDPVSRVRVCGSRLCVHSSASQTLSRSQMMTIGDNKYVVAGEESPSPSVRWEGLQILCRHSLTTGAVRQTVVWAADTGAMRFRLPTNAASPVVDSCCIPDAQTMAVLTEHQVLMYRWTQS
jgi:E3 ubiquitin-protein ligase RFWD3